MSDANILIGPYQVAFDITNKCNLRCLHCYNNSGENLILKNELNDDEVISLINDIAKMKVYSFCFCGGETLLRKELLLKCSKILSNAGINVSLVTNGLLLTKELAYKLKKSGVSRIQISLDGAKSYTHDKLRNKKGAFLQAITALKILNEIKIQHSIAFTPTAFNINDLLDVYEIAIKFNVSELRLQPLMLMGRASNNLIEIMPSQVQYRKLVKNIYDINNKNNLKVMWGDPIQHLFEFKSLNDSFTRSITIRANGDILATPYIPLIIGNIRKHTFLQYWENGLGEIWSKEVLKKLADNILSINDLNRTFDNIPKLYNDNDLYIDLIDNDLNDLTNL